MPDSIPLPEDAPPLSWSTTPQYDASAVVRARNLLDVTPEQIGRYRILERIGGGGMGEVYRAEQRSPVRREVAIKLIKLGMDTKLVIARFEAERQALAMMDHPNIAKVYDADADNTGRPFFVMEYVKGKPITEYADANHLSIEERLGLFEQVCHAIQHAHHKGIIHRDLKPSNVLVSTQDSKPYAKVIDFGIAKATSQRLTDKTLYTQHEQFIGTPQYVSPEQADGSLDIDTRTDVYSLGVLLYELLTGSTPFASDQLRAAAVEKIKQLIRDVDPPRPSTRLSMSTETLPTLAAARRVEVKKLGSLVRGELDWIVMKALEKDRRRRYETPTALANDIRAHLEGEPVTAAPPTAGYRLQKFVTRHKTPITVVAVSAVLLVAGVVVSTWQALRAGRAERTVTAQLVEVDQQRKSADENRRAAQEAQGIAEQQAKLAAKSASLSQARYLVQQGDLPGAMAAIKQAASAGLSFADRLVLDEAYRVARDHWTLVSHVHTGVRPSAACIVDFDDDHAGVVFVVGNELISVPIDPANTAARHLPIDLSPQGLLATHVGTVIGWTPSGRVRAFTADRDKLIAAAKRDFPLEIESVSSSDNSVTCLFIDGSCRMLDGRTLEVAHEWPATALPESFRNQRAKRCFASPDGNVVIVHRGAWNMPAYILRPAVSQGVEITDCRMGFLAFSRPSPALLPGMASDQRFFTWEAPSANGGLPDQLTTYQIDGASHVRMRDVQSVDSVDTKRRVALRVSSRGQMTMFGEVGVTWIGSYYARATLPSVRYTSLWPFGAADPEFLAADETANRMVLSLRDGMVVFNRNGDSPLNLTMDNYSSWGTSGGVVKVSGHSGALPMVVFEPYDPGRSSWSILPQWVSPEPSSTFRAFSPWRIHVTPDEHFAVILAQEGDGSDTVTSSYGRKVAMVYELGGDIKSEHGWASAHRVELTAVNGLTAFNNGALRVTPDGKTVLFGINGQLHRYDVASGQPLGIMDFGQGRFDLSRDGTMVIGRINGSPDLAVYDTVSARPRCDLGVKGSLVGAAFAEDGQSVAAALSGGWVSLFEIPSGQAIWTKRSKLIPRTWPATGEVFLAMIAETSGDGAMLVLADKNNLEPLGVVSKATDIHSDCGFSPAFDAIQTQTSRWQSRVIHMVDPDGLAHLLKTPTGAGDNPSSSDVVEAAAAPAVTDAPTPLRGDDLAAITKNVDRVVTVEATVSRVTWTAARNAVNIECAGGATVDDGLLVWVNVPMLRKLRAAGMEIEPDKPTLEGQRLRVRGRIGVYGGYNPRWKNRPQIYAEDPKAFEIIEK